ncbi:hypothetical protein EVG20_g1077 [Dentipellis fragilis]|uniref:Mediator of RNA polymerase II transcription subunit 5 n=1 Tax=Dentipellis fragilis TaxID=205917 RepID=A0A4Y9ZDH9_9AGAM|nr:hypothetical protein EVG20_g1077 [Dentipellis fragilis]
MSLLDLTRNAFQSGLSPSEWIQLCTLFIAHQPAYAVEDAEKTLSSQSILLISVTSCLRHLKSDSVLILFRTYPGDPALQAYIRRALQSRLLSLRTFIATFLQAARSPELHNSATLEILCKTAWETSFSHDLRSSNPPISENPDAALGTIRDALVLLQTVNTITTSPVVIDSASKLLFLLLDSTADITSVSSVQAMACIDDAKALLQFLPLSADVTAALRSLVASLSLLTDEVPQVSREVQRIYTNHTSLVKGDVLGPGSGGDNLPCKLLLYHLVSSRATNYTCAVDSHATTLLLATFRAMSCPLTVFYVNLFTACVTCLMHNLSSGRRSLWRAFVLGRLPSILVLFQKDVETDSTSDPSSALRDAWGSVCVSHHTDHIFQYDHGLTAMSTDPAEITSESSFAREFTQQLLSVGLVDQMFAARLDPALTNESFSRLQSEARETNIDLEPYISSKLSPDNNVEDISKFFGRVYEDFACHPVLVQVIRKRFALLTTNYDIEGIGHLAKALYTNYDILDLLSLHIKIPELVAQALAFFESYDCESVGDPQTAVSHLGDVLLFIQLVAARYDLQPRQLGSRSLLGLDLVHQADELTPEQNTACDTWFKALFDKGSEGIEDGILRSTRPKTLLTMAATLCSRAAMACFIHNIDADTLNNGMSYFLGPLLNWTLVGIVKMLLREIRYTKLQSLQHLNVLRLLVLSQSCPRPVLCLCGSGILRLLSDPNLQRSLPDDFDIPTIRQKVDEALGINEESLILTPAWQDQPRDAIDRAMAAIRSGGVPAIDVPRCLAVMSPTSFLQLFWTEFSIAASVATPIDTLRYMAVFVLASPRLPGTPPLLPIFVHNLSPSLMDSIDQQSAANQSVHSELLASIISSAMMFAFYLERAISASSEHHTVFGESTSSMASRLVVDLRHRKHSSTAKVVAQRLTSSSVFVANFPMFKTEI